MSCDTSKAKNCKIVYDPPLTAELFFTKSDINAIFLAFQGVEVSLKNIFKIKEDNGKC